MAGGIKGGRPEVSFHCSEKAQILVLVVTLLAVNFFFFIPLRSRLNFSWALWEENYGYIDLEILKSCTSILFCQRENIYKNSDDSLSLIRSLNIRGGRL